ncbi:hypothetical protein SVA_2757 [Sulfurifustis variabilis]|uniref:Glycoside hydrolase family 5 domain-containing protein n=1 Tax=Sulfurifustis variabilis TaxID=1675686 RepID=A0A1B4V762_9GAMM|nr:hypothetical protein [Sulfurifustis variabilis]BAU49305.1 hypothetical protein SVA_2757 [Sulfurifustis variabilis]
MGRARAGYLVALYGLLLAAAWSADAIAGAGLHRSGRWFAYEGRPVYLVGFDVQELACNPALDYERALDELARYRLNKVRIWTYCWFGTTRFGALTPWVRDASGRHDLERFDERYWARVRDVVAAARKRRIFVEVTVFAPYPNRPGYWWGDPDVRNAWNAEHNVNGVFTTNAEGHFYPQFYDLDYAERGKRLRDYQRALVEKTVSELGAFDNVYFEIANEFAVEGWGAPAGAIERIYPWQRHWARAAAALTDRPIGVHADADGKGKGARYYADEPAVDVLNFRLPESTPEEIGERLRPFLRSGRILAINEAPFDFHQDLDGATRYAWAMFLSGGHFAAYEDDVARIGSPQWRAMAKRLQVLRETAESVDFRKLSPVDRRGRPYDRLIRQAPAAGSRMMADPGRAYIAWFWGRPAGTPLVLKLPGGRYVYRWQDARDGRVLRKGSVEGGGIRSIAPPPAGAWQEGSGVVLAIRAVSTR